MPKSLMERMQSKFTVEEASGCWTWNGATADKQGKWVYGVVVSKGKLVMAHRAMYELQRGPIPDGLQLDHLCRNTRCINPAHLEPVTAKENIARAVRTHCVHGHVLSGENVYFDKQGQRECRICRKAQWHAFRERHGLEYVSKEERRNSCKSVVWMEYEGERLPLRTFAERFGLSPKLVAARIRSGWSNHDALTVPSRKSVKT